MFKGLLPFALITCLAATTLNSKEIPLEAFFSHPAISKARLSPTGEYVAFRSPSKDRIDLIIFDLDSNSAQKLKGSNSDDVKSLAWVGDEHVAFNLTLKNQYAGGLFVSKTGSRKIRALNEYDALSILDPLSGDDSSLLTRIYASNTGLPRTVLYNPINGHSKKLDSANSIPGKQLSWFSDGRGNLAAVKVYHDEEIKVHIHNTNSETWTLLEGIESFGQRIETLGYDRASEHFWFNAYVIGEDKAALYKLPADDSKDPELVWKDDAYDMWDTTSLVYCPYDDDVLGIRYNQKGPHTVWFDKKMQMIQDSLDQGWPDTVNRFVNYSKDQNRILVYSYSDRNSGVYRVIDISKNKLMFEMKRHSDIPEERLHQQYTLNMKMRDDVKLQAYLTLPGSPKDGPYPMVALVHGGPWSRDVWGYDSEVQLLASRGYAVFQLNFRGSSGFGKDISLQYSGDFEGMVRDVADGTRQLIKKGWIDGERLAVMGTSFGGYAAIASQMFEPGLFNCSISYAGTFDLEEQIDNWRDSFWTNRQGSYAYDH